MPSNLGLDLSPTRLRAIEIEGSAKKPVIRRFEILDFERQPTLSGGPGAVVVDPDRIAEFIKEHKFNREPAALGFDANSCIFRELDLPFTSDEQIRKVIKFEAESHLQANIEEMLVCFKKLGKHRDKSHLLLMTARKDKVIEKINLFAKAAIDPIVVDLELTALFNTVVALGYTGEHACFVVVDCEPSSTSILFIAEGELVAARSIRMGSDTSGSRGEAAPAPASTPPADAGGLADEHGDLMVLADESYTAHADEAVETEAAPVASTVGFELTTGFLGKLAREIRRTMVMLRLKTPVEVVYTTGPGAALPEFREAIASELGAPAQDLDIQERIEIKADLQGRENEIAVPLGLALKLLGQDAGKVDFRQEEARYAKKFDQIKVPLTCFAMLVLILILLLDLSRFQIYRSQMRERQDIARLVKKEYQLSADESAGATALPADLSGLKLVQRVAHELETRRDELSSQLGREGSIPGLPSALTALGVLFRTLDQHKQQIGPIVLTKIDINLQTTTPSANLTALVKSRQAYEDLKSAILAEKDFFPSAGDSATEQTPDQWTKVQSLPITLDAEALVSR